MNVLVRKMSSLKILKVELILGTLFSAIPIYNKYYKRYSARVKVRQIKEADFKKWKYQAMSKRDDCTDGIITPEEFTEWMENSFPNRKPKA